jgi:hypothetical protein
MADVITVSVLPIVQPPVQLQENIPPVATIQDSVQAAHQTAPHQPSPMIAAARDPAGVPASFSAHDTGAGISSPPTTPCGPAVGTGSASALPHAPDGSTSDSAALISTDAALPPVCSSAAATLVSTPESSTTPATPAPGFSTAPAPVPSAAPPPASTAAPPRTRLQDRIWKPKKFNNGTVGYAYSAASDEPYNLQEARTGPH